MVSTMDARDVDALMTTVAELTAVPNSIAASSGVGQRQPARLGAHRHAGQVGGVPAERMQADADDGHLGAHVLPPDGSNA